MTKPFDHEQHTCATCRAPLNQIVRSEYGQDTEIWLHPPGVALDNHAAVPVTGAEALHSAMVCDVCSTPQPAWSYPTNAYTAELVTGMPTRHITVTDADGAWAICGTCARLVEGRDIQSLVKRALALSPSMRETVRGVDPARRTQMKAAIKEMLSAAYGDFFAQINGPRKPLK